MATTKTAKVTTETRRVPKSAARVRRHGSRSQSAAAQPLASASAGLPLVRQIREWAGSLLGITVAATEITITFARQRVATAEQKEMLKKTGSLLRSARKAAGMSIEELGKAIDMKDPVLLDLAENGKAALPFEMILRLTSILGRKDPVVFFLSLARSHNPKLWKLIQDLGVGRLLVQTGREREFANIYRGCDAARELSDAEFARVVAFMQSAFQLAMNFHARNEEVPCPQ